VADNANDGFNVHRLDDGAYIRTLHTDVETKSLPRQVAFAEETRVVVGGSCNGVVYVFDRKTGTRLEILRHAKGGLIQTIAVRALDTRTGTWLTDTTQTHERDGVNTIFSASSQSCDDISIAVWQYGRRKGKPSDSRSGSSGTDDSKSGDSRPSNSEKEIGFWNVVVEAAVLVAAIAFLWQNVGRQYWLMKKVRLSAFTLRRPT
jgi:hypothetical protein